MEMYIPYCPRQAVHGHSHQRYHKQGWVVTQRRCLDGSTTHVQASTLDAKTTKPPCIVTSPVLCQHQPDNEKPESRRIFIDLFVACSVQMLCCKWRMLWPRLVCVKLSCSMLWHLKCIEQSHCVSGPTFDSLRKNLVWWAVTWET